MQFLKLSKIRSFIRNDGLMKQPRMAVSMARAYGAVGSRTIQGVVIHELQRIHSEHPELLGWHKAEAVALLSNKAVDPRTLAPNAGEFGGNSKALLPSPAPYSLLPTPGSTIQDKPKAPRSERATRIPEDFHVTDEMRAWARGEVPTVNIDHETKRFILHYEAASGTRATFIKWESAWKNWMLRDYKPAVNQSAQKPRGYGRPGERKSLV